MSAGNEGPKRADFKQAAQLPACGEHCADVHGDQAFSERELEEMRRALSCLACGGDGRLLFGNSVWPCTVCR